MSYATQQDLIDRFGQRELIDLTDRAEPATGVIDPVVVAAALTDADELIDSYVGKRYDLPLTTPPPRLVKIAADLARFYLYEDRVTEAVQNAHDTALAFLKDVSAGRAVLDVGGDEPASVAGPEVSGPDRLFSRESTRGY